jgi:NADP-dependent 3-hydroxy acid dehydrogenase YdfG
LKGKTAVVTGGSSGIGLAVGAALAGAGARVILVARRREKLEQAGATVKAEWLSCDVTDAGAIAELAGEVRERFKGEPDIVVNAAGAFELSPIAETSIQSFDAMIAANLRAVFLVARTFLPGMLARGSGHLVSIGSVAGRQGFANNGAYSASKFGVRGLHAVLEVELRGTGVRASLVEPAATDTALWDAVDRDRFSDLPNPSGMLSAEAVAEAVLYMVRQPPAIAVANLIMGHA